MQESILRYNVACIKDILQLEFPCLHTKITSRQHKICENIHRFDIQVGTKTTQLCMASDQITGNR